MIGSVSCAACTLFMFVTSFHEVVRVPHRPNTKSSNNIGFGSLPSLSEYKIVHLLDQRFCGDRERMGCEVFTFRDGEDVSVLGEE